MPYKTIDVTLASIRNVGPQVVSPRGYIFCKRARAQDDEQIFQTETLYDHPGDGPIHPSGATGIGPGQSLSYNVTKQLTIHHYGPNEMEGRLNEMLMFHAVLTDKFVIVGQLEVEDYTGFAYYRVQFSEIGDGFQTITGRCSIFHDVENIKKIEIIVTTNLISQG